MKDDDELFFQVTEIHAFASRIVVPVFYCAASACFAGNSNMNMNSSQPQVRQLAQAGQDTLADSRAGH